MEEENCGVEAPRYSRQLPLLGEDGQRRLLNSKVAVIGLGGLGSIVAMYLASAGVGYLKIVDSDNVDETNLNRQLLYDALSVGLPKAYLAAKRLRELNPCVNVEPVRASLDNKNIEDIIGHIDLIIDCLDNWRARLLLGRYSMRRNIPLLHAAVEQFYGQLYFYKPGEAACIECIAPRKESRRTIYVMGPAVGVVASLQALMAIMYLSGQQVEPGVLWVIDSKGMTIDKIPIAKNACYCEENNDSADGAKL